VAQLDRVISYPSTVEFDEILFEVILAFFNALIRHVSHHVTRGSAEHKLFTIRIRVIALVVDGRKVAIHLGLLSIVESGMIIA